MHHRLTATCNPITRFEKSTRKILCLCELQEDLDVHRGFAKESGSGRVRNGDPVELHPVPACICRRIDDEPVDEAAEGSPWVRPD